MDGQSVRAHPLHGRGNGAGFHAGKLHDAEIGEQENVWRDVAYLVGGRQLGLVQHGALASKAEGDAEGLGSAGHGTVDGSALARAAGHARDENGRGELVAKERGAKVDIGKGQLGQGAMNEVHVLK